MGQTPQAPQASSPSGGLEPNIAALLGYLLFIPAILWLVLEPYKNDRFVRFHAFQTLGLWVASVVLSVGLTIFSIIIAFIPVVNILAIIIWPVFSLAMFVVWILLMVKAYQKEMWKLPLIGDFAMKQAG